MAEVGAAQDRSDATEDRSLLLSGLRLVMLHPGALLWTYAFNVGLPLLFSLRLHTQLRSVLDHSLAATRLSSAFDVGTLGGVIYRLLYHAPADGSSAPLQLPYLLLYFVLVPGTLHSYATNGSSHLPALLGSGLKFFWRFVRITLLTLLASGLLLGPLIAGQVAWSKHVEEQVTGSAVYWRELPVWMVIALIAALLRLYFDLVEVYTVQLAGHLLASGKADRRVRHALLPALRTLRSHFVRAYLSFVGLALLGLLGPGLFGRTALHLLAQPSVWPIFLLAQMGLFWNLLTRFWQRGLETVLAADHPLAFAAAHLAPVIAAPLVSSHGLVEGPVDAQSDPEPAAPSLQEPDPGVFHPDEPGRAEPVG